MREKTYRIGEAADMLRLKSYVLRFWETEFPQLAPLRTDKGQRLYTDYHIALLHRIRQLLHEQGMTIEGARRVLASAARGEVPLDTMPPYAQASHGHASVGQAPHGQAPLGMPASVAYPASSAHVPPVDTSEAGYAPASAAMPAQAAPHGGQYGGQQMPQQMQQTGGPTAQGYDGLLASQQASQQALHGNGHSSGQANGQGINRSVVREMREELLALRNMLTADD